MKVFILQPAIVKRLEAIATNKHNRFTFEELVEMMIATGSAPASFCDTIEFQLQVCEAFDLFRSRMMASGEPITLESAIVVATSGCACALTSVTQDNPVLGEELAYQLCTRAADDFKHYFMHTLRWQYTAPPTPPTHEAHEHRNGYN